MDRSSLGTSRTSLIIPIEDARNLHRLDDPDAGDVLLVVTALGPARGFIKAQDFVELRALGSSHGVVVQPFADDLNAELTADKVVLMRPAGLTLSVDVYGNGERTRQGQVVSSLGDVKKHACTVMFSAKNRASVT